MTSLIPSSQSHDLKHMYNLRDIRTNLTPSTGQATSVYGFISKNPDFTIFKSIVIKAGLDGILDSSEFNGTVFIPSDAFLEGTGASEFVLGMDKTSAISYVKYSMLPTVVNERSLRASPSSKLKTRENNLGFINVKNINNMCIINNTVNIVRFDIISKNGVIHVTDKLMPTVVII